MTARGLSLVLAPVLACAIGEPPALSGPGFGVSAGIPGDSGTSSSAGADPGSSSGALDESSGLPTTDGGGSSGAVGGSSGVPGSSGGVGSSGAVGSTGGDCAGGCDAPGACEVGPGACMDGQCVYSPAGGEVLCDDGDACTEDDACDGAGACQGAAIGCERPNAGGGVCVAGVCQGFDCAAPWENCDGDWDNGCEVPTGVANQCDQNGLNPDGGCWTAYCGQSADPKARNFAGFFCYDCANCNTPGPGLWQWCNHTTGNWYPSAAGACGISEDLVCAPA